MIAMVILGLCVLESCLRFRRFPFASLKLRLWYGAFLLNAEATKALSELHQRVEISGLKSFEELFKLYAAASGKSPEDIRKLFGLDMSWWQLVNSPLALKYCLQWHIGLVPVPNQQLRTMIITEEGTRSTGLEGQRPTTAVKRVMLMGDSLAFGYGATSDSATIAGRLEHYLNSQDRREMHRWVVTNHAFPAATSFQELLLVLQRQTPDTFPDYCIALTGCNDIDQQFGSKSFNVSGLTQGYTRSLQESGLTAKAFRFARKHSFLLASLIRFAEAYAYWPGLPEGMTESGREL